MDRHFVTVVADVDCEWVGPCPVYRVFVNNEMFTERTWLWTNERLEEMISIHAPMGDYTVRWELVPPHLGKLKVTNVRVGTGPGHFIQDGILRIHG